VNFVIIYSYMQKSFRAVFLILCVLCEFILDILIVYEFSSF